ncbi:MULTISPECIES: diguanylate cyclase [unclassified Lysobacter]|uniref:GGDEF domain-containing protein n=1 Tax=unclassified Lysobacter TaxID=2635362 RepID=UPI001BE95F2E|nr:MULTISPECIES: diguanylate cyclase [unclassified Lysobacter]MBT2748401.1 diguanylate cyclase [Lysobacter sp. ISL-42]MBT2749832.1 diguanylate cyclase [Lysobacter sp. ISL-50]MBT2781160.1 diguanylate cyclase [Lysobacter sp. ISL-52]
MRKALWALMVALACLCAPAAAQSLKVEVLMTDTDLQTPPVGAPVMRSLTAERPDDVIRFSLPRRSEGYWLRLTSQRSIKPGDGLMLVVRGSRAMGPLLYYPPGAAHLREIQDAERGGVPLMRRGWVLSLPNGWPTSTVAYVRIKGRAAMSEIRLSFASIPELARQERGDARFMAAAFTAMMLMAVAMVGVWVAFRDFVYLGYGAYLACMATYLLLRSGDASEMWGLAGMASEPAVGWALATLATIFQIGFSLRFLDLPRLMPRTTWVLRSIQWANMFWLLVLVLLREHVYGWWYIGGNALLLLGVPLMLVIAVVAWRKGAPYAGYYLLGWTPMLVLAAALAANILGLQDAEWAERGLALTAVLESAVLALALSQHAANRHRIVLLARQSVERDPLTGALNAQVLEQMLEAWSSPGSLNVNTYGLLLVDLDGFGEVNARYGRAVGDALLQQALSRMRGVLSPDDTIARMEGDCFGIVSECERGECELLARRIGETFAQRPFRIDGHEITISVSIGLAMSQRGEQVAALFERVRFALRNATAAGRNAVSVAQSGSRDIAVVLQAE